MGVFLLFIGAILAIIGVIFIFDARIVAEKYFSTPDINRAVSILKAVGLIILIIAWLFLFYNYK